VDGEIGFLSSLPDTEHTMPPWTDGECRILIVNRDLSLSQLRRLLPRRSVGAIRAALGGIDQYLRGRDVAGLLSARCLAILEQDYPR
jgi:hypothetical protein